MDEEVLKDQADPFSTSCTEEGHSGTRCPPHRKISPAPEEPVITDPGSGTPTYFTCRTMRRPLEAQ
jgi:hypothetical protein